MTLSSPSAGQSPASCWCIVANITDDTKHFSPGTKIYLFSWTHYRNRVKVIGKHRNGRLITMIIDVKYLNNFRIKEIFTPFIVSQFKNFYINKRYAEEQLKYYTGCANG